MANTATVTATVPAGNPANLTLAHNIGRTPHYVVPTVIHSAGFEGASGFTWGEVSRDASVYVVVAGHTASLTVRWECIYKHSAIR